MSTVDIGVCVADVEGIGVVVPDADADPPRGAETNRVDEDNDSKIDFDDEAALDRLDEAIPWFNPAAPPDDGLTRPGRGIRWALKCEMKVGGVAVFGPAALTYGTIIAVSATVSASCCQCKLCASSGSARSPVIFTSGRVFAEEECSNIPQLQRRTVLLVVASVSHCHPALASCPSGRSIRGSRRWRRMPARGQKVGHRRSLWGRDRTVPFWSP